jgi:hypothetical protein
MLIAPGEEESFDMFCSRASKITKTASGSAKVQLLGCSTAKGARKKTLTITPETEARIKELKTWLFKERDIILVGETSQGDLSLLVDAWARGLFEATAPVWCRGHGSWACSGDGRAGAEKTSEDEEQSVEVTPAFVSALQMKVQSLEYKVILDLNFVHV